MLMKNILFPVFLMLCIGCETNKLEVPQNFETISLFDASAPIPHNNLKPKKSEEMAVMYGPGLSLIDSNGDGKTDVFVGGLTKEGLPACFYENSSTKGNIDFKSPGTCFGKPGEYRVATSFPTKGLDRSRLFLLGENTISMRDLQGSDKPVELMSQLPEDDVRRKNVPTSVLPFDLNQDGHLDFIVGYGDVKYDMMDKNFKIEDEKEFLSHYKNFYFINDGLGNYVFEPSDSIMFKGLEGRGITLAMGAKDVNGDGLQDIMIANDHLNQFPGEIHSGFYLRCSIERDCAYEFVPIDSDKAAESMKGNLMGFANLKVENDDAVYISDIAKDSLLRIESDGSADISHLYNLKTKPKLIKNEKGEPDLGKVLFSWGLVADDLTGNGHDDLFIANGHAHLLKVGSKDSNVNQVALQT